MLELLTKRRSIRKYKDEVPPREVVDKLVKAALLSPTSKNSRPWEIVVVDDREILQKLSRAKDYGSTFLKNAPVGIVILADSAKSDVWVEDASIAATIIQLTAEDLGLGSCWIQIRKRMHDGNKTAEECVKEILGIPANINVEAIVALGYPDEIKEPHSEESLPYEKVYRNTYGNKY
ncbi:MAG: Nitroreductase family protein [Firmicutes bacterium]|nr:Nitroreductase family protein [Bacillota bacterium]MDI6704911.1 nitroreductase family protein [Bacillota bacterium]